jgi:hypothetical protein
MRRGRRFRPSYSNNIHKSSSSSSSLAKQPFLIYSLPQNILPNLAVPSWIRSFLFWFYKSDFFNDAWSSALRQTPNLENNISVYMSPSDRVSELYPQAPGSLFFSLHQSLNYCEGILTSLHTGQDAQVGSIKSRPLHNALHFTHPHKDIISTHEMDTIHWSQNQLTNLWPTRPFLRPDDAPGRGDESVYHASLTGNIRTYNNIVTCLSDYRRGLDWQLNLLTT